MKSIQKIILLAFALMMGLTVSAQSDQSNAIKWNPLSTFAKRASLSYERKLSSYTSLQLTSFYALPGDIITVTSGTTTSKISRNYGFAVIPEFKFYPGSNAMSGFYTSVFAQYGGFQYQSSVDNNGSVTESGTATRTDIAGGILFGYQYVAPMGFTVDVFGGPRYCYSTYKYKDAYDEANSGGNNFNVLPFFVRLGVSLGYAF